MSRHHFSRDECRAQQINLIRLSEMLAPGVSGAAVESAERLLGGFANSNYKVSLSGITEALVVRIYVRDSHAAAREAAVLNLLRGYLPVARVLHLNQGRRGDQPYAVLTWMEGDPLNEILAELAPKDGSRVAYAVGSVLAAAQAIPPGALAKLSCAGLVAPDPAAPHSLLSFVHESLFEYGGRECLGRRLTDRLWRFVDERAPALSAIKDHGLLVHGDFNPLNVLARPVRGQTEVSAVLDWEHAHLGSPLLDIGSMLRCQHDQFGWFEAPFLSGYADNGGILPSNWKSLGQMLDLANLCRLLRSPMTSDVAVRGVKNIIESTLESARSLT